MDSLSLQLILTGLIIILIFIFQRILFKLTRKALSKVQEAKKRLVHRLLSSGVWILAILALVLVWGGSIQNLWISVAGMIGIVAIGFFAVWSILSNVVAGAVLMLVKHLDIGDRVEILPEKVKGKIVDITAFFVVLEGKKDTVLIPNNQFIQKIVRKI